MPRLVAYVRARARTQGRFLLLSSFVDRREYATLRECVYLNQASLGLIADPAVEAMRDLLDRVVRHGNLRMSDEDEAAFLDNLRRSAARLLSVR